MTVLLRPAVAAADTGTTIAVLLSARQPPFLATLEGFRDHLSQHREEVDYRLFPLYDRLADRSQLLDQITRAEPDLVFALGSEALETASQLEGDIPTVAGMILRQEDFRTHPGTSGVYLEFPPEVHFRWLKRILPKAETVGVLYNRKENRQDVEEAAMAAEAQGLDLVSRVVDDARELPAALGDLARRVDVLWGISDEVVLNPQTARHILLFSFRQRIPFIGLSEAWVKAGAFYALDRDYRDVGRQCAEIALEVMWGGKAGEIRAPREVIYVLNLKAARQMRISLPEEIVRGAEEVF